MMVAREQFSVEPVMKVHGVEWRKSWEDTGEMGSHTCHRFQTLDEYLHVAFTSGLIEIEIGTCTGHFVSSIGKGFVHLILRQSLFLGRRGCTLTRHRGSRKHYKGITREFNK